MQDLSNITTLDLVIVALYLLGSSFQSKMRKNLLDTGNVFGIEGGDGAGRADGDGGADA